MNTIDLYVTDVLSKPELHKFPLGEVWSVEVMANSHGSIQKTTVYTKTKQEAESVCVGYKFQG